MSAGYFDKPIRFATGLIATGAAIAVRDTGGTLADIFSNEALSVSKSNPGVVDADGRFIFYADQGEYDITVGAGASAATYRVFLGKNTDLTFSSRADLVTWWASNSGDAPTGVVVSDGAVQYVKDGDTGISDLSGLSPFGDVTPNHFAENTTPGTTDMSSAITAANTYCTTSSLTLEFLGSTYACNNVALTCDVNMQDGGVVKFNGSTDGYAVDISANGARCGTLIGDGSGISCSPIVISGNNVRAKYIESYNVIGEASAGTSFSCVRITGDECFVDTIYVHDISNGTHPNGSFPQAVTVLGDNAMIGRVICRNAVSGVVTGSLTGTTQIGKIMCENMTDNGLYQLGGNILIDEIQYNGTEEPAVFIGSGNVGTISIIGAALGVGFQTGGSVTVDHIQLLPDAGGNTPKFAFRTRPGSVDTANIRIGKISGRYTGSTLFAVFSSEPVRMLNIDSIDVTFDYDAAVATSISSWCDIRGCLGFNIKSAHIDIVDINNVLTSGDIFYLKAPSPVALQSSFSDFDVAIYNADQVTESTASFRGENFAQTKIRVSGMRWRTDIGPYLEKIASLPNENTANAVPTSGTWVRGQRLYNVYPNDDGLLGWVCTSGGTPGTWVDMAELARFGIYYSSGAGINIDTVDAGFVGLVHDANSGTWPVTPASLFAWITTQAIYSGDAVVQRAIYGYASTGTPNAAQSYVRMRSNDGSGWSAWAREQPERGSNANGEYVRFPDGTQICVCEKTSTDAQNIALGALYRTAGQSIIFPARFSTTVGLQVMPGHSDDTAAWFSFNAPLITTVYARRIGALNTGTNVTYRLVAIGRWF